MCFPKIAGHLHWLNPRRSAIIFCLPTTRSLDVPIFNPRSSALKLETRVQLRLKTVSTQLHSPTFKNCIHPRGGAGLQPCVANLQTPPASAAEVTRCSDPPMFNVPIFNPRQSAFISGKLLPFRLLDVPITRCPDVPILNPRLSAVSFCLSRSRAITAISYFFPG